MQVGLSPQRLIGRAMLVVLAVTLLQVAASILFYEAIDRQTIREDHARRVAELLVVSRRLDAQDSLDVAKVMSTKHLDVAVASAPTIGGAGRAEETDSIKRQIIEWEPELAVPPLSLAIDRAPGGREHLIGSMQLDDGDWLNFRSHDISAGWPIALRAIIMTLALTLICLLACLYVLRLLGEPLRQLTEATRRVGEGRRVEFVEKGPADLRNLSRSFNEMQERIALILADQAKAFEAISHDLRTPISRLKVASDFVEPQDIKEIVDGSTAEMDAMLTSLLGFLRAQNMTSEPEKFDLALEVRGLLAPWKGVISLESPDQAPVFTYREPLNLALRPLIENAVQYGGKVDVRVDRQGDEWQVHIKDNGPGIPDDCMDQILDPFFRVDEARARDTAGFGLGIPTAHRLLQRFGGKLDFRNDPSGGLHVTVSVPHVD